MRQIVHRSLLLLPFLFCLLRNPLLAQTLSCDGVTAGHIITKLAECPGGGEILLSVVSGGRFELLDDMGRIFRNSPDEDNSFKSLSAGDYKVRLYCEGSSSPQDFNQTVGDDVLRLTMAIDTTRTLCEEGGWGSITLQGRGGGHNGIGVFMSMPVGAPTTLAVIVRIPISRSVRAAFFQILL